MLDNDDLEVTQDELTTLKARADMMGISYHPSIGVEKLRAKIEEAMSDAPAEEAESVSQVAVPVAQEESAAQRRARKRKESSELIRVRITCMNPNKKDWEGEIITAGNTVVGTFTKFIPFNVDEGWHVPRIIYNQLVQRQCQIFTTTRDSRGNNVRTGKMIREFNIEVLPPLTKEELAELARRQAMSKAID